MWTTIKNEILGSHTFTRVLYLVGFAFMLVVTILSFIYGLTFISTGENHNNVSFNFGMCLTGIAVDTVMFYGCIRDSKERIDNSVRPFVLMIFLSSLSFIVDLLYWSLHEIGTEWFEFLSRHGVSEAQIIKLSEANNGIIPTLLACTIINEILEATLILCFWNYVRNIFVFKGRFAKWSDIIVKVLYVPTIISLILNYFYPIYFYFDANGVYHRTSIYYLNDFCLWIATILSIIHLFSIRGQIKRKVAAFAFVLLPLSHYLIVGENVEYVTGDAVVLIAIIYMYTVLFSDQNSIVQMNEAELSTASEIQKAMLPNNFPYFKDRDEFDIYSSMTPAREVGGDFYDFFLIDDNHLCMIIADVSGKGVPAALFMVSSKTIISNYAKNGRSPARILEDANNEIFASNERMLFVSVWLGILEISTGVLTAANAGHEYPAVLFPDKQFDVIKDKHGMVLGARENIEYEDYEIKLEPGSKVFVYTDGVAEATDTNDEIFGIERMVESLNAVASDTPKEVLESVKRDVDSFVKDAEQFDDITMLCLMYNGKSEDSSENGRAELIVPADVDRLDEINNFIYKQIENIECNDKAIMQLELAVEELFVNIASYAYAPFKGDATIYVEIVDDDSAIVITFVDEGREYNPLKKEDPDINASTEDRSIGGLGIYMTKQFVDDIKYEYKDMKNILTIKKVLLSPR